MLHVTVVVVPITVVVPVTVVVPPVTVAITAEIEKAIKQAASIVTAVSAVVDDRTSRRCG
ncbi:MAG: hypothetical protein ACRDRS_12770 [Pseudonocardiaceae bacterium]